MMTSLLQGMRESVRRFVPRWRGLRAIRSTSEGMDGTRADPVVRFSARRSRIRYFRPA